MGPLAPDEREEKGWRHAENNRLEAKLVMNASGWVCSAV